MQPYLHDWRVLLAVGLTAFVITLILQNLNQTAVCTIRVTGESVSVTGCAITPEIINAIANLHALGH
ncbi:triple gene block protein 3 [Elderberry carlavirus C]|uniref:Movement protein TGBp3 n=1 Tax=Elderberry carlavirus C TaxID=1569054 RepID=A0A0A7M8U3_9VIRU|nr:triple gene block protein 3 [Elderberry carlavirus C]AIZ76628.1 triple gene block protein 3 [Elderberry carlavirus C]